MISRTDCFLLLAELKDAGYDITEPQKTLVSNSNLDISVLKFIKDAMDLDVVNFYEKLRKNYNNKKSKIYKEIIQIDEREPKDMLVTIYSYLTQISIFAKDLVDKQIFFKHCRCDEIIDALSIYYQTFDSRPLIELLNIIRADIKLLESL